MVVLSYEVIFAIQGFSHRELTKNSMKSRCHSLLFVYEDLSTEVIDTFIIFQKGAWKEILEAEDYSLSYIPTKKNSKCAKIQGFQIHWKSWRNETKFPNKKYGIASKSWMNEAQNAHCLFFFSNKVTQNVFKINYFVSVMIWIFIGIFY